MSIRVQLALVLLLASTLSWAQVTVFDNVRLIDPLSGTVSEPQTLIIKNGLIVDGPAADSIDRRIERGGFLIPGLAEMHAHVPPVANSQQLSDVLTLFLAHGVTTIRGMLGEPGHLDAYAQALIPESHALYGTDPGFFGINLVDGLDESMIADVARRTAEVGIANVPTQTLLENIYIGDVDALMNRPAMRYIDEGTKARWQEAISRLRSGHTIEQRERFIDLRRQLIAALSQAGARLLLGADAPQIMNVPGDSVHHELALYVEAGLSPAEALATGTVNVASYLGQAAYGCLQPGCVADLILLEGNPLDDIDHTRRILGVMRAGHWFDRATLDGMLDEIAERAASQG